MTNYEKYKDWFIENQLNIISGRKWGVKNGKPYLCGKMLLCCDCLFNDGSGERWLFNDGSGECEEGKRIDWLEEENY